MITIIVLIYSITPLVTMEGAINFCVVWLPTTLIWLCLAHIFGFGTNDCIHCSAGVTFNYVNLDMVDLFFFGGDSGRCSVVELDIQLLEDVCIGKVVISSFNASLVHLSFQV
jgi:hypothetical protein